MRGKSRREQIASMSQAEREDLIPLARKVRTDAGRPGDQGGPVGRGMSVAMGAKFGSDGMSVAGGKADVPAAWPRLPSLATGGHLIAYGIRSVSAVVKHVI